MMHSMSTIGYRHANNCGDMYITWPPSWASSLISTRALLTQLIAAPCHSPPFIGVMPPSLTPITIDRVGRLTGVPGWSIGGRGAHPRACIYIRGAGSLYTYIYTLYNLHTARRQNWFTILSTQAFLRTRIIQGAVSHTPKLRQSRASAIFYKDVMTRTILSKFPK